MGFFVNAIEEADAAMALAEASGQDRSPFIHYPAYDIVLAAGDHHNCISELYFTLEDCNLTPIPIEFLPKRGQSWDNVPTHAPGSGGPLWKLRVDSSGLLADMFPDRWVSLKPIHPDPAVDPGVPLHMRPQQDPRWYWYRQQVQHYETLGGKMSASKWWPLLNAYKKKDFVSKAKFRGNPSTRAGRTMEPHVAIAYLSAADPRVKLYECGTYVHPDPELRDMAPGTPDAIICLLYTSPSPRDRQKSRMPSSA